MIRWFKQKLIALLIGLSKTEANIRNEKEELILADGKYQSHKQGMLSHSLINGEMTEEVKELRWRYYKILRHQDESNNNIIGYDEDGYPILDKSNKRKTQSYKLKKYKTEKTDSEYPLKMVVKNNPTDLSTSEALKHFNEKDVIKRDDFYVAFKPKRLIKIKRSHLPQFKIEEHTNKMLVREVNDETSMLEFFISKYPTEDKRSRLLINHLIKLQENGDYKSSSALDFDKVLFISDGVYGCGDGYEFEYETLEFHRIVTYEGDYILKFLVKNIVNGEDIFEKFRMSDLDLKYERKEKK